MPTLAAMLLADAVTKGGPGSGNFGHTGRPGEVGGSGEGGSGKLYDELKPGDFKWKPDRAHLANVARARAAEAARPGQRRARELEGTLRANPSAQAALEVRTGKPYVPSYRLGAWKLHGKVGQMVAREHGAEIHIQGKGRDAYVVRVPSKGGLTNEKVERAARTAEREFYTRLPRNPSTGLPSYVYYKDGARVGKG